MVSVQFGASLARGLFGAAGAYGTTALRLVFSTLILAAVLRPWRGGVPRGMRVPLLAYGVCLGVMNLLFYLSLRTVPLGIAVALEFVGPMALTLAEARRVIDLLWVGLLLAGLWLLLPLRGGLHAVPAGGALLALAAGACWAVYIVQGGRISQLGARAAGLGVAIAALTVVPVGAVVGGARLLVPATLGRGTLVALFSSAVPYTLEMVALARVPRRLFGTLMGLEPAMAALMGAAMLHQTLSPAQLAGIAAVMVAAVGTALTAPKTAIVDPV